MVYTNTTEVKLNIGLLENAAYNYSSSIFEQLSFESEKQMRSRMRKNLNWRNNK